MINENLLYVLKRLHERAVRQGKAERADRVKYEKDLDLAVPGTEVRLPVPPRFEGKDKRAGPEDWYNAWG